MARFNVLPPTKTTKSITKNSLSNAVAHIDNEASKIIKKLDINMDDYVDEAVEFAQEKYDNAYYAGVHDVVVSKYKTKGRGLWRISAKGESLPFIEWGAGPSDNDQFSGLDGRWLFYDPKYDGNEKFDGKSPGIKHIYRRWIKSDSELNEGDSWEDRTTRYLVSIGNLKGLGANPRVVKNIKDGYGEISELHFRTLIEDYHFVHTGKALTDDAFEFYVKKSTKAVITPEVEPLVSSTQNRKYEDEETDWVLTYGNKPNLIMNKTYMHLKDKVMEVKV